MSPLQKKLIDSVIFNFWQHQQVKTWGSFTAMLFVEVCPYSYFWWCWYFWGPWSVICYDRWVLSEVHKSYFKDWCLMNSQLTVLILTFFQTNLSHITFWNLALPIFEVFVQILLNVNLSWIKLSWHSCSMRDKLGWLNWF